MIKKEQEKQQLVEHMKTMLLEEWLEEQGKPSKWMEEGPPGLLLQWSLEDDSGLGRLERSGSLVRKGKLISWTTEVEVTSLVEVRERVKTEMKQWLLELTMVALEDKNEIEEAALELAKMRIEKEDNVVAKGVPDQIVPDQQLGEDNGVPAPQVPPGSEHHQVAGRAMGKKRKRKARTDLESSRSVLETDICQFYDSSGKYKSMPMLHLPKDHHHVGDGQQAGNIQVLKTNKKRNKYLLVGVLENKFDYDENRMSVLNTRIQAAATMICLRNKQLILHNEKLYQTIPFQSSTPPPSSECPRTSWPGLREARLTGVSWSKQT